MPCFLLLVWMAPIPASNSCLSPSAVHIYPQKKHQSTAGLHLAIVRREERSGILGIIMNSPQTVKLETRGGIDTEPRLKIKRKRTG